MPRRCRRSRGPARSGRRHVPSAAFYVVPLGLPPGAPRPATALATAGANRAPLTEAAEDVVRRLLATARRHEARLPAREVALVAQQKPDEHLDARVLARDRERLRQVLRLPLQRDAEDAIRRVRLVAVLGDPDRLAPVEARHLADQDVDVAERDRRPRRRPRAWRLGRPSVVGLMRVGVEAACTRALQRLQEEERRSRGTRAARLVVAARARHAAGDLLARARRVHSSDHRVADARVVACALDRVATAGAPELRPQEDRVVGLVPREPVVDLRQSYGILVLADLVAAAIAARRRGDEVAQVEGAPRRDALRLAAVRPPWGPPDRADDLDLVL